MLSKESGVCVYLSGVRAKYDDSGVKYTSTSLFLLLGPFCKARFKSLLISVFYLNTPARHMIQCRQGSHVSAFVLLKNTAYNIWDFPEDFRIRIIWD